MTAPESSVPDTNIGGAPTSQPSGEAPAEQPESGNGLFSMILVGAVVIIGGGAALYFKVIRKKCGGQSTSAEYEEEYVSNEPEADLPPWDEQEDDHV